VKGIILMKLASYIWARNDPGYADKYRMHCCRQISVANSTHSQRPFQYELGSVVRLLIIFVRVCSSSIQAAKHTLFDISNTSYICAGNQSEPPILN
jgi:hypothetical protein